MPEWWEGNFDERMARRRARREAQGWKFPTEHSFGTWERHGTKLVRLKKRKAKRPFNYEEWLHRKAGAAMDEDRIAKDRLREIWNAVIIDEMNLKWLREAPLQKQIKAAPRVRGCGAAAKKAGF